MKVEYASKEVPNSPFTVAVETGETKPPKVGKPMEQKRKFIIEYDFCLFKYDFFIHYLLAKNQALYFAVSFLLTIVKKTLIFM